MSARWREIAKWLGITMVLPEGGYGLLVTFKNIISEKAKIKDMLGIVLFSNVYSIWKGRNVMVFNQTGFEWDKWLRRLKY
jgi:hypothetical protein